MPALNAANATTFTPTASSGTTLHSADCKYWKKGNCVAITMSLTITGHSNRYAYLSNIPQEICVSGQNNGWGLFYLASFRVLKDGTWTSGPIYPCAVYTPGNGYMIISTHPFGGEKVIVQGSMIYFI